MSVNGSPVINELRKWERNNSKFINTDSKIPSDESPVVSSMSYMDLKILEHLCHFTDLILGLIPILGGKKEKMKAKIGTAMPCFNNLDVIKKSLPAVYSDECYVVMFDDGSSDGTKKWIRENYGNRRSP